MSWPGTGFALSDVSFAMGRMPMPRSGGRVRDGAFDGLDIQRPTSLEFDRPAQPRRRRAGLRGAHPTDQQVGHHGIQLTTLPRRQDLHLAYQLVRQVQRRSHTPIFSAIWISAERAATDSANGPPTQKPIQSVYFTTGSGKTKAVSALALGQTFSNSPLRHCAKTTWFGELMFWFMYLSPNGPA